jgi:iron complex transport system ATP-binding protein
MSAALQARLQSVHVQGHELLHTLALRIARGRWTAVVGPNGAGKSTLLRALAGLIPSQGEIELAGRPLRECSARERATGVAWLGQHESGADDLCAHDVVMLGRLPHRPWLAPPTAADHAAVQTAMTQTQSWDWRERRLATLSGGERQRVLLARVLAVQAPLTLMDEPLAHLDPPHQADWLRLVRERVAAGAAVVSVLHELNLALQADELVVMGAGRILHHGLPHEPATHAALQAVFEQRLRLVSLDGQWLALPNLV